MAFFPTVKLLDHKGSSKEGGSNSQIFLCDDNKEYYVKSKTNPQGGRILANELIANGLAQELKLPCRKGAIVHNDKEVTGLKNNLSYGVGLHFGTENLSTALFPPVEASFSRIANDEVFSAIILFDTFVNNCDRARHFTNYLLDPVKDNLNKETGEYKIYLVDHGHCFGNPTWTTTTLEECVGTYPFEYLQVLKDSIQGLEPFAEPLKMFLGLTDETISEIVNETPVEWGVSPEEKVALIKFLSNRRDNLPSIIESKKSLFQHWT